MTAPIRLRVQQTRYPHWGRYSGIGQYLRRLPADYDVEVRTASDNDEDLRAPRSLQPWLRRRVQRSGMGWYKLSDLAAELHLFRAALARRADIIHFQDGEHGAQFLPRWLAHAPGPRPRLVVSYHQPADLLGELVRPQIAALFDHVVLVAPSQAEFFGPAIAPEKLTTILHGVDVDFFRPAERPPRGPFRCVSAGHWLRDWRAIKGVAERFADDPGVEFHVVTGQPTGLEGLPNVRFWRGLSDEQLRDLYQSAGALLLPLEQSTANNTVLEGMACGLPVISTDLAPVRTYLGPAAEFLSAPGDVDGLAADLARLRASSALRKRAGNAARARALELSWDKVALEYDALYRRLLGRA